MTLFDLSFTASALGAVIGLLVGLLAAPWSSTLIERPPLQDATEAPGLPFRCSSCRSTLSWAESVPLVSYFVRRARCGHCGQKIGWIEPLNDVLCALVGAACGAFVGVQPWLPAMLVLSLCLVPMSVVDLRSRKIATRLVYPAALVTAVLLALAAASRGEWRRYGVALLCGLAVSAFIWLLWLIYPKGMGAGDARLCLLLGMGTGWFGWEASLLAMMAGFVLGSIVGVPYSLLIRRDLKAALPFGPFLAAGAVLMIFFAP